jgi:hypothetical protein
MFLACRIEDSADTGTSLLDLPDTCLLVVLRCCASDHPSLFSAAQTHSRLHQAAAAALTSISTTIYTQEQLCSLKQYLTNHKSEVLDLAVQWAGDRRQYLRELPQGWRL